MRGVLVVEWKACETFVPPLGAFFHPKRSNLNRKQHLLHGILSHAGLPWSGFRRDTEHVSMGKMNNKSLFLTNMPGGVRA